jgi:hypothetical protein
VSQPSSFLGKGVFARPAAAAKTNRWAAEVSVEIMKKYFICQTDVYKSYIFLPDDWSGIFRRIFSWIIDIVTIFQKPQNDTSLVKSIIGPNQMFINIIVTPLKQDEPEPSIESTSEYFDGLAYRQNLFDESTSTIKVLSKDHFTATYYRATPAGAQLIKKYCLYIERLEYLITAILANISRGEGRPDQNTVSEKEIIYDGIVKSFVLEKK